MFASAFRRGISALAILLAGTVASAQQSTTEEGLVWQTNLEAARKQASQENRLLLVHFGAPWCQPCKRMEKIFEKPGFGRELASKYVAVRLNKDHFPSTAKQLNVEKIPADIVLTADGHIVERMVGARSADQYVSLLSRIADDYQAEQDAALAQQERDSGERSDGPSDARTAAPRGRSARGATSSADAYADAREGDEHVARREPARPRSAPRRPQTTDGERHADERDSADQVAEEQPRRSAPRARTVADRDVADRDVANGDMPRRAPNDNASQTPAVDRYGRPIASPEESRPSTEDVAQESTGNPDVMDEHSAKDRQAAADAPRHEETAPADEQANATTERARIDPSQLPPGAKPLCMEGFCSVTLRDQKRWQIGDPRFGATHRGRTYLFAGEAEQQKFLANPDFYSPVLKGNDPVMALDQAKEVAGLIEYGVYFGGRIYLFASEQSRDAFGRNPDRYITEIMQANRDRHDAPRR